MSNLKKIYIGEELSDGDGSTNRLIDFVQYLLVSAPYIHLEHFIAQTGFIHTTLEDLYNDLPEWADRLSETVMLGKGSYVYQERNFTLPAPEGVHAVLDWIVGVRERLATLTDDFKMNQGVMNIIGEIDEKLGGYFYKLTLEGVSTNKRTPAEADALEKRTSIDDRRII